MLSMIILALASALAVDDNVTTVEQQPLTFYSHCEPSDATVRGDTECCGKLWEAAESDLRAAVSEVESAIAQKQARLLESASQLRSSKSGDTAFDQSLRAAIKATADAARDLSPRFAKEQRQWQAFAEAACGYLHNRSAFGANGQAVIGPACDINIVRDRARHLRALAEAINPDE